MKTWSGHSRAASWLAAIAVVLLGAACTSGSSDAPPAPLPTPHYAPVPHNLCGRLRLDNVVEAFGLELPPTSEPSTRHHEDDRHSRASCVFATNSDNERFAIGGVRYEPTGSVVVSIYRDRVDTAEAYRQGVQGLEYRQEARSGARAPVDGWWDEGEYYVAVEDVLARATIYDFNTGDASNITVDYAVRHENLYLQAQLAAAAATQELDQATEVLHDLMVAVIDEIASHLARAR